MQIKRFEARSMTEALRQIKRELGTEAVILSAKDIRKENRLLGISRKVGVEVTAAVDDGMLQEAFTAPVRKTSARGLSQSNPAPPDARRSILAKFRDGVQDVVELGRRGALPASPQPEMRPRDAFDQPKGSEGPLPVLGGASRGPEPGVAAVVPPSSDQQAHMQRRLVDGGLEILPWPFKNDGPHHIALVGSAGVGKTTTIAKLAARLQHAEGRRVGLISLDREKVGGIEQLQIYADILKIPLAIPQNGQDLERVLKQLDQCDVVLVDTPAIIGCQGKRCPVIDDNLRQATQLQVWLVIGADTQIGSMQLSATMGDDLAPSAIVITKIDLSPDLGTVMRFLSTSSRPVVCLTNGPDVPRDLAEASHDLFARLLIQNGHDDEAPTGKNADACSTLHAGPYLANRSSDIVHRAGCKWIRLINAENVVAFASFAEALNSQFKPCRYCNPQQQSITGIPDQVNAERWNTDHRKRAMASRSQH